MPYCYEYCLVMPDDFPVDALTAFMASARSVLLAPEMSPVWVEFTGASNLVGWRFRAASEYWETYKNSVVNIGNGGGHEQLYRRERALFGMFTAGVSCIESTTYAMAALASHSAVLSIPFGLSQQRACNPRNLVDWLVPYSPATALRAALTSLLGSEEWKLWVDLRNWMTHRSNLPPITFASIGGPLPVVKPLTFAATSSTPSVDADFADFDKLHSWLARSLETLLSTGKLMADGA